MRHPRSPGVPSRRAPDRGFRPVTGAVIPLAPGEGTAAALGELVDVEALVDLGRLGTVTIAGSPRAGAP